MLNVTKPSVPFTQMTPRTDQLRYAGTLSGQDIDLCIVFKAPRSQNLALGEIRQLSYQGAFVHISYIPLFSTWAEGDDYVEVMLLADTDLVMVFGAESINSVIEYSAELLVAMTVAK